MTAAPGPHFSVLLHCDYIHGRSLTPEGPHGIHGSTNKLLLGLSKKRFHTCEFSALVYICLQKYLYMCFSSERSHQTLEKHIWIFKN